MKLVLNACGVDSLGGVKLFKNSVNQYIANKNKLLILYSNEKQISEIDFNENVVLKKISLKRFFHPFLNLFLDKKTKNLINDFDGIIHYGNFGFKTNINSYIFIQNLLPFNSNSLKNKILKMLITNSFKYAEKIIIQLPHMKKVIEEKFKEKVIEVGRINIGKKDYVNNKSVIVFGSTEPNKNFKFILKTFDMFEEYENFTIINPSQKIQKYKSEILTKDIDIKNLMNESSIYFHASNYETVGLPLYEASDSGLIIVAPNLPYMQYFDSNNVFTYEHGNLEDAKKKLVEALSNTNNSVTTYSYDENWIEVLKDF